MGVVRADESREIHPRIYYIYHKPSRLKEQLNQIPQPIHLPPSSTQSNQRNSGIRGEEDSSGERRKECILVFVCTLRIVFDEIDE
ncbi:hypothetical protein NQZ68_024657 [Dissostichus eleginoides]|nr:hypothetical protein NQZ68_024657 [Dissostichus eleginoides]